MALLHVALIKTFTAQTCHAPLKGAQGDPAGSFYQALMQNIVHESVLSKERKHTTAGWRFCLEMVQVCGLTWLLGR